MGKADSTELDREVVAKVYKDPIPHEWRQIGDIGAYDECEICGSTAGEGKGEEFGCIPPFSLDMRIAWQLLKKITEGYCDCSLEQSGTDNWTFSYPLGMATGMTPAEAICLAALDGIKNTT